MLEVIRRGRRWGTAAVVVLVGGVFAIYVGVGTPSGCGATSAVIDVDGEAFYRDDFLRTLEDQENYVRELAGEAFDPENARDFIRANTANVLITTAILAREAERAGMGVSREELRDLIRSIPIFQDPETGLFSKEAYERHAAWEYGNEANFLRFLRIQLLAQKMSRLLAAAAHVSEAEGRDAARYRSQEVRLAFVALETGSADPAELTDEEVAAFAAAHAEAIQQRYEEKRARYEQDEAVRARHILIRVPAEAEEAQVEEARGRAQEILSRIREGADFVDVALELSEDPGSQAQGGDLGFFGRGQMTPAFEEVAFSLEPGRVSDLVRSDFGFHIIRVEERREARHASVDEVRDELARELLAEQRAGEQARERAEQLSGAVAEGGSLEQAARDLGLSVERSGWLRRRPDGFVPGLGASLAVQDTAFALDPGDGASSPRIFEVDGKLALIQVLERREPEAEQLEEAARRERERLLEEERQRLLSAWVDARRARLQQEGRILVNLESVDER